MDYVVHIELLLSLQMFSLMEPSVFASWCPSETRLLPSHSDWDGETQSFLITTFQRNGV